MNIKKIVRIFTWLFITFLVIYSVYFIEQVVTNWKIFLTVLLLIISIQMLLSGFVRLTYRKVLNYNSVLFTFFVLYVFCVTIFFLFINILTNFF